MERVTLGRTIPVSDELFSELTPSEREANRLIASVSARIHEERVKRHMSQEDFADFLGVSQEMVSRLECCMHNLTIESLVDVLYKLGVTMDIHFKDDTRKD